MYNLKTKLGKGGRIVIPAIIRQRLKLKTGDNISLRVSDDELCLSSFDSALKKAQALVQRHAKGKNLVDELIAMRREDNRKEGRRDE